MAKSLPLPTIPPGTGRSPPPRPLLAVGHPGGSVRIANDSSGMISAGPEGAALPPRRRAGPGPVVCLAGGRTPDMCTYLTEKIELSGSAKGAAGWITVTDGSVYLDHPVHAPFGHSLNIDFLAPELGPSGRVAVELSQESARALAKAIEAVLESAPPGLE